MKVFISVDMEGISGIVASEETGGSGDYAEARKTMTLEANAAVEGALAAGAKEIVVNDSHGGGQNILPELFHPDAILSRGQPLPSMVAPLDDSFDAAMVVGYHAKAGTCCAVLDHTYRGSIHCLKLNGREFGELGMAAAYAGHVGVPFVFASGDDKLAAEAQDFVSGITTVVTKFATGRTTAKCLSPTKTREQIREGVTTALANAGSVRPFVVDTPVELEVTFSTAAYVDKAACMPGAERVGGRGVRGQFGCMSELARFLSILIRVSA